MDNAATAILLPYILSKKEGEGRPSSLAFCLKINTFPSLHYLLQTCFRSPSQDGKAPKGRTGHFACGLKCVIVGLKQLLYWLKTGEKDEVRGNC